MKRILTLAAAIACCTFSSLNIHAEGKAQQADYNIVPLPRSIVTPQKTGTYQLLQGALISYPTGDAEMQKNATFLRDFIKQSCGLTLSLPGQSVDAITGASSLAEKASATKASAKKTPAITLSLLPEKKRTQNTDAYTITVDKKGIAIQANTGEGIFRAIQTLRKSVGTEATDTLLFPYTTIQDEPRFAYRGQHLDVARHFFSAQYIKQFIDILALHGVNQFHWHITDDQGWRFDSKTYPDLAPKAAIRKQTVLGHNCYSKYYYLYDETEYGRDCFYSIDQMREIVKYAQDRYINIIPEIDLPGHMVAALHVYPELGCTGGPYDVWGLWGVSDDVLCAGNPGTLTFLKNILSDVCDIFPSKYIHIGGDESPRVRWQHCPKCQAKMKELGLTKEAQLQTYINKELEKFLDSRDRILIGWDETLEGGLSEKAIVMSWRGTEGGIQAAQLGHRVIMSPNSHCYIDHYQLKGETQTQPLAIGGYLPMSKVYNMEPVPADLTPEQQQYIWGPQCNLWTEYVISSQHVEYMLLPRLAAMSEVQWMTPDKKNFQAFEQRLKSLEKLYDKLGYLYCPKYE